MMERTMRANDRLMDLERTVSVLNGRLLNLQWELQRAKAYSLPERIWRNIVNGRQGNRFMSTVCSRHIRPNMKVRDYAGTTGH
ncbi:protein of unknown function [Nitrospira japonica]|uniref:Uncharacterized protein n=1 Tax=Nitrospira japonica TaxID=1325564 RepID=A0A1W1I7M0_9BACT|nr:hypothetical protein [Nitrospira japonica]SLM49007.1 protein of unknown function [Nitrospira japonica]